ncbi:MAG: hypothetical protein QOJ35_3670 [Solirubrobacteraceae bacterium]|nr:hypothetical protein [Solirubrobacteraceae bacterium]
MNAGDLVAGYRIESVLGRGGMGTVYEATQLSLNRTVALKILSPQLGSDVLFRERFRREGHIQAAIDHPNIVTVYEAGEAPEGLFLAMRLVRGSNLKDMIVGRDLEGARTLRLLKPIADALDSAHEAGLTHRDIKPQNILVGLRDHPYLADFGLTKSSTETGLTKTGQFVGTIDYISPEQIRGEPACAASDIYALTAVLYECLCGVVPYPKPSDAAVLYAHISNEPPLVTDQRPELPPALDEVIARGMAKNVDDRPRSASEMIAEAERAFGKRVRAVITPPGPVESAEEIGLREEESRVSTRESRVRGKTPVEPAPPTVPAEPVQTVPSAPVPDGSTTDAAQDGRASPTVPAPVEEPAAEPTRVAAEEAGEQEDTTARTVLRATPPTAPSPVPPSPPVPRTTTKRPRDLPPARTPAADAPFGRRRRVAATAAAGLLVLAVVGFVIGHSGGGSGATPGPATPSSTASNTDVEVALPAGWRRTTGTPPLDLGLGDAMTLGGPGAGLVVGRVRQPGVGLLPQALVTRVEPRPGAGDPVRTTHLEGYRHDGLRVAGTSVALDVLTVPTTTGTLAFACTFTTPTPAARAACRGIVDSARLLRGKPAPVGANPAYAGRLNAALMRLNGLLRSGRRALRGAATPRGQAQIATGLARDHAQAAAAVRAAEPGALAAGANSDIARALDRASDAYKRLAAAARSGSRTAYRAARQAVRGAELQTSAALAELETLGYARPAS